MLLLDCIHCLDPAESQKAYKSPYTAYRLRERLKIKLQRTRGSEEGRNGGCKQAMRNEKSKGVCGDGEKKDEEKIREEDKAANRTIKARFCRAILI